MALAASALRSSPHFRASGDGTATQASGGRRRAGFDHVVLSTACIEGGLRAAERYGALAPLPLPLPLPLTLPLPLPLTLPLPLPLTLTLPLTLFLTLFLPLPLPLTLSRNATGPSHPS